MSGPPLTEAVPAGWHPDNARTADYSGKSNLALAFLCLPPDKRADMNVFYTFCRLVDDIADSPSLPPEEKTGLLNAWREVLLPAPKALGEQTPPSASARLTDDLHALVVRYRLPPEHLLEIIAGVEMDIVSRQYTSFEQLRVYCYRVASVVGLVSIEIFGYRDNATRRYAVELGMALQITNIIRDVVVDLDNGGRIYLPLEDMERFGYMPSDLRARVYDKRFQALMTFEAQRADEYYRLAVSHLSALDRQSMVAAEIMRAIYWRLLRTMQRDRFRVFDRRYRLGTPQKLFVLLGTMLKNKWA